MFEIFINEMIKIAFENKSHLYIDKLNKLMNSGSVLNRRESLDALHMNLSEQPRHRSSSTLLSSNFAKPTNRILKIPTFTTCSWGANGIISFLSKELEVRKN